MMFVSEKRLITSFLVLILNILLITGCGVVQEFISPSDSKNGSAEASKVLFFDDFEDGVDPDWWTDPNSEGHWIAKQGWYTLDENSPEDILMRTFVGSASWRNYSVEMDVASGSHHENQVAIFLRVQNADNMIALFTNLSSVGLGPSGFMIRKDGIWKEVEPTGDSIQKDNFHLLITVEKDTYTAYVNRELITSVNIPNFHKGYVGLQAANPGLGYRMTFFDNFKVTGR